MTLFPPDPTVAPSPQRLHLRIQGMVQGVGFRPFVYGLARELGLGGWVRNDGDGVELEIEGAGAALQEFLDRLVAQPPRHSCLTRWETTESAPQATVGFEILPSPQPSPGQAAPLAWVLPDLATCNECRRELFDPSNRRYLYPLINCTHCGPRFSILEALPYDRCHTTMAPFRLCPACEREYSDPGDRRFHAQPNACPVCGPHLELWGARGEVLAVGRAADQVAALIEQAVAGLRQGQILALKGLGGFHLLVDARNQAAVQRLRDRKQRPRKPLALMYPSLAAIQQDCEVSPRAAALLTAAAAPILLLPRRYPDRGNLAPGVAPDCPDLGVMLPSTPLHHLLLAATGFAVVATSGNASGAPLCSQEQAALEQLQGIADRFLVHNRPIAQAIDDSVVCLVQDRPLVLRRARGYTPQPLKTPLLANAPPLLALGGHLKNAVALALPGQMVLSQYLGDLDHPQTLVRLEQTIAHLLDLYRHQPQALVRDAHPDYASSHLAQTLSQRWGHLPVLTVQHHYAHVLSGLVDNQLAPPVLGIAWDGLGYGDDGSLWGGEAIAVFQPGVYQRVATLRPFPLPGGEVAAREPRRAALGLLYAALGEAAFELESPCLQAFNPVELRVLQGMLRRRVNTPLTSSVGRLFDAIAALVGLRQFSRFEGEAAMQLEFAQTGVTTTALYPYRLEQDPSGLWVVDWQPLLLAILQRQMPVDQIAAQFHNTLADLVGAIAQTLGLEQVLLTGGCFQNRTLLQRSIQRLRQVGCQPYWHQQIPPNDGGLAVGQLLAAHWTLQTPEGAIRPCA